MSDEAIVITGFQLQGGDLPSVQAFVIEDDALYEILMDHDTVREQTGEDA